MHSYHFIKNFLTDKHVAYINPTSRFGVKKVCRKVDLNKARLVVEYGPGTGAFTQFLLKHMPQDSILLLIERNKNFVSLLKEKFPDPRIILVNDSAENIDKILKKHNLNGADAIISGIPFFFIPNDVKLQIVENTHKALKHGGKFLAYQTFYQAPSQLQHQLEKYFGPVQIEFELRNIPPLRLYDATKQAR